MAFTFRPSRRNTKSILLPMMKSRRRAFLWLLIMTLGWLLSRGHANAYALDVNQPPTPASHYQRPEDLFDMIPILGKLPRTFLIGDGYKMKLSGDHLRIDHMGSQSKSTIPRRDCMIGISYVRPVAGFFTSRVELPLFYAPEPKMSEWSMNSLGDYVAFFSKGASESSSVRLAFSAKF
jgi:hypothetical protein